MDVFDGFLLIHKLDDAGSVSMRKRITRSIVNNNDRETVSRSSWRLAFHSGEHNNIPFGRHKKIDLLIFWLLGVYRLYVVWLEQDAFLDIRRHKEASDEVEENSQSDRDWEGR